jgi:hypothetical protein
LKKLQKHQIQNPDQDLGRAQTLDGNTDPGLEVKEGIPYQDLLTNTTLNLIQEGERDVLDQDLDPDTNPDLDQDQKRSPGPTRDLNPKINQSLDQRASLTRPQDPGLDQDLDPSINQVLERKSPDINQGLDPDQFLNPNINQDLEPGRDLKPGLDLNTSESLKPRIDQGPGPSCD